MKRVSQNFSDEAATGGTFLDGFAYTVPHNAPGYLPLTYSGNVTKALCVRLFQGIAIVTQSLNSI